MIILLKTHALNEEHGAVLSTDLIEFGFLAAKLNLSDKTLIICEAEKAILFIKYI